MTGQPLRIVHVARDIALTGGGEVVKQVAARSAAAGHLVTVVTDGEPGRELPGVRVTVLPPPRWVARLDRRRTADRLLAHLAEIVSFTARATRAASAHRRAGDVVVNHNLECLGGDIVVMHNFFSREWLTSVRADRAKLRRGLNPVLAVRVLKEAVARLWHPRYVVAVSAAARPELERFAARAGAELEVVANGIDTDTFVPDPTARAGVRTLLGLAGAGAGTARVACFVGHELERKGLAVAVRALAQPGCADVHLMVVGGGGSPQRPYLALATQLGVADRLHLVGTRADVPRLLAGSDVLVLPSAYETMPLVVLEALACGVPVVISPECPAKSHVSGHLVGRVVERDPAAVAAGLLSVLDLAGPAQQLACRAAVLGSGWDGAARRYEDLVRAVAASRGDAGSRQGPPSR